MENFEILFFMIGATAHSLGIVCIKRQEVHLNFYSICLVLHFW